MKYCPVTFGCADPEEEFVLSQCLFSATLSKMPGVYEHLMPFVHQHLRDVELKGFYPSHPLTVTVAMPPPSHTLPEVKLRKRSEPRQKATNCFLFEASTNNAFSCGSLFWGEQSFDIAIDLLNL